jgi:acetyltransferase-like isoleucine patch superfamily enzyme
MHSDTSFAAHPLWSKVRMGKGVRIGQMARFYGDPSKLTLGDGAVLDDLTFILALSPVYIGAGVEIGPHSTLQAYAPVTINDGARLMAGARIVTRYPLAGAGNKYDQGAIVIGSFAVVGPNAVVLPNAVIAACADVSANGVEQ